MPVEMKIANSSLTGVKRHTVRVNKDQNISLPIWDEIQTIPHQIINQIVVVHMPIKVSR